MNKYFLLLITSFASLSLNAAEGQPGKDEWNFIERGESAAGKHYIVEDKEHHFLIQVRNDGESTGHKRSLAGGVTVKMSPSEMRSIVKECNQNLEKFEKILIKKK